MPEAPRAAPPPRSPRSDATARDPLQTGSFPIKSMRRWGSVALRVSPRSAHGSGANPIEVYGAGGPTDLGRSDDRPPPPDGAGPGGVRPRGDAPRPGAGP